MRSNSYTVFCRIGSLEIQHFSRPRLDLVFCRIGSLEMTDI